MEEVDFMAYNAAHHQGVNRMFWPQSFHDVHLYCHVIALERVILLSVVPRNSGLGSRGLSCHYDLRTRNY